MKINPKNLLIILTFCLASCLPDAATSEGGIKKAKANIKVQSNGLTVEQENVKRRLEQENIPGSIKHLYLISAYSGEVILYSTVKGKVTSSGKRLTPSSVESTGDMPDGFKITIDGASYSTTETLGDDGTYGSSVEYLYWWDAGGKYNQIFISGGTSVIITDQPTQFGRVTQSIDVNK